MRLHRFFLNQTLGDGEIVVNSADLAHQIKKVFRLKTGDPIIFFNGSGKDFEYRISNIEKDSLTSTYVSDRPSSFMSKRNIYLCASVIKKDKFEWVVEKATELGVTHIIPILSERAEKKDLNIERLRKIAIEASEQSGRGNVPEISDVSELKSACEKVSAVPNKIIFDPGGSLLKLPYADFAVFIGPEGGWTEAEMKLFKDAGFEIQSLGAQILRAETAAISSLSLAQLS